MLSCRAMNDGPRARDFIAIAPWSEETMPVARRREPSLHNPCLVLMNDKTGGADMIPALRWIAVFIAALGLAASGELAYAQGKGKDKERSEQKGGAQKEKKAHHQDGKSLLGDKIKQDGNHALHQHGKFTASVDASKHK